MEGMTWLEPSGSGWDMEVMPGQESKATKGVQEGSKKLLVIRDGSRNPRKDGSIPSTL